MPNGQVLNLGEIKQWKVLEIMSQYLKITQRSKIIMYQVDFILYSKSY